MTTKQDLLDAIAAAADSYLSGAPSDDADEQRRQVVGIALGTPGQRITIAGEVNQSNAALSPEPTVFATVIEGFADWLDGVDVGQITAIKSKLNELIAEYNQLRADYNAATVPTTAAEVSVLP